MDKWRKDFIKDLAKERTTYDKMIEFCADSLVLNNYIIPALEKNGFYFEPYCGNYSSYEDENGNEITREQYEQALENGEEVNEVYNDIYQYFIIDGQAADRFSDYTNELVLSNDELDLYVLCVKHWGTSWSGVSANWKNPDNEDEGGNE